MMILCVKWKQEQMRRSITMTNNRPNWYQNMMHLINIVNFILMIIFILLVIDFIDNDLENVKIINEVVNNYKENQP